MPSSAAAGACPRTSPTCCSCASTASTSRARDVVRVASAAGQRVPHDLLARVAPVTEDQLEVALRTAIDANVLVRTGDAEYAFRHALLGEAVYDDLLPGERMRLHTAYAEAVRELHGSRRRRRPGPARAGLARPAHRPARPASRPATRRWPPADPTRPRGTSPRRWRSTRAPRRSSPTRPTRPSWWPAPSMRCAARAVPRRRCPWSTPTSRGCPPTHRRSSRARLLLARVEALRSTETDAQPSLVSGGGAGARRPRADPAAGPDPRHARPGADLGRSLRRGPRPGRRGDRAGRPARPAAPRRRRRRDPDLAQPAPRPRRGQPGRAEADHRRGARHAATCSARCAASCGAAGSSTTTASSPRRRRTSSRPPRLAREIGRPGPSRASAGGCRPR